MGSVIREGNLKVNRSILNTVRFLIDFDDNDYGNNY